MQNPPIDITEWLREHGMEEHVEAFLNNHIDFDVLRLLSEENLTSLGVDSIGQRLRLQQAIKDLPHDKAITADAALNTPSPDVSAAATRNELASITQTRRQLTVMFLDLVGSTNLSRQLDPEDYGDLIGHFRKRCSDKIIQYGGFIAQFMGDGILVYFGYPVAHENAAIHAVTSAMEIIADVHGSASGEQRIILRAGIATGFALAGNHEKATISGDINVLGEVPNLAARIQDAAKPGTLLVSELTQSLASGVFEFTQLPPTELKGIPNPVSLWQVNTHASRPQEVLFDYFSEGSKFFNRASELKTLTQCWEAIPSNSANIVAVCGEAGIGKTSLLRQISRHIASDGHRVFTIGGSSLQVNTAFYPLIAFIKAVIKPQNTEVTRESFTTHLQETGINNPKLIEPLLKITGLAAASSKEEKTTDPIEQRELAKATLLEFLLQLSSSKLTAKSKFLLLFEDLHWWDASSLEVLKEFLSKLNKSGILVVVSYRNEFEESWIEQPGIVKLKLETLEPSRIQQIVESNANGVKLGKRVVDEIIGRAGGNPLFAEELTKSMAELNRDTASRDGAQSAVTQVVPYTLQDSLMARLDRLSAYKEIAQISAIIGRDFSFEELKHVAESSESTLLSALSRLVQADLLTSAEKDGAIQYRFTHALVHEAAYNSVPKRNRKLWHGRVAAYLEKQYPSVKTIQPDLLAHHYFGAGNTKTAVDLWHAAGTQAMMQSANREAAGHFRSALVAIDALQSNASGHHQTEKDFAISKKISVLADLGNVLTASEGYAAHETGTAYQQAWGLIKGKSNSAAKFSILYGLWNYNLVGAKTDLALGNAFEFHEMAKSDHNSIALMAADCMLGQNLAMLGRFSEAHKHLQNTQRHSTPERRQRAIANYGEEPTLTSMSFDAWMLWHFGQFEDAANLSQSATRSARKFGHVNSTALALTFDGLLNIMLRFPETALQRAEEVLALTNDQDLAYWEAEAYIIKGKSLLELGDKRGVSFMETGLEAWKQTGAQEHFVPSHISFLATGYRKTDRAEDALRLLDEAFDIVERTKERWFLAELHRIKSECLAQLEYDNILIEAEYLKAVTVAKEQTSYSLLIKILNSYYQYLPQREPDFLEQLRESDEHAEGNQTSTDQRSNNAAIANVVNIKTLEQMIAMHPASTIYPDVIEARHLWSKSMSYSES